MGRVYSMQGVYLPTIDAGSTLTVNLLDFKGDLAFRLERNERRRQARGLGRAGRDCVQPDCGDDLWKVR